MKWLKDTLDYVICNHVWQFSRCKAAFDMLGFRNGSYDVYICKKCLCEKKIKV